MSDPLSSLKKTKRPPLFLPEMSTPSSSRPDISLPNQISKNISSRSKDRLDPRDSMAGSSMSNYYFGYSRKEASVTGVHSKLSISTTSNDSGRTPRNPNLFLDDTSYSRVPFKNKIDNSDLMDEITTKMAAQKMKNKFIKLNENTSNLNTVTSARGSVESTPNDMELMQLMMGKIKQVEARCAIFEAESKQKDLHIKSLQMKIENIKSIHGLPQNKSVDVIQKLEKENLDLRNQINEMEEFLNDYGLHWVGNSKKKDENNENTLNLLTSTAADTSKDAMFKCDYDLIIQNINELNSMTDYNEPTINYTKNGAKFETKKSVPLILYANGISLYDGPFRSFNEALTKKFCIDIIDGYFPSELETAYPDGVPFSVVDKREVFFKDNRNPVLKSDGYRLGNPKNNTEIIETQLKKDPMTIEQFLNKLPTSIIKNGKLINIREDLADKLNHPIRKCDEEVKTSSNSYIISTPAFVNLQKQNPNIDTEALFKISRVSDDENSPKISTIRVKSLNSTEQDSYLIKMYYTDTVQQLKNHIKIYREQLGIFVDFDLGVMFPKTILQNYESKLEAVGLGIPKSNIVLIQKN